MPFVKLKALLLYADSESPGEGAHPCSLIWTFSARRYILQYPLILLADNEGPDQPALMRRLIRTFVFRKFHKGFFARSASFGKWIHSVDVPPLLKGRQLL